MHKVIFLDIDGVIATPRTVTHGTWGLTDDCQDRLGIILQATGAKIVLSSSWRLPSVEETRQYMSKQGFLFSSSIAGVTIRAYKYIDKQQSIHLSIPRGVEIKQWIDIHLRMPWYAYPETKEQYTSYREDGSFKSMNIQELGKDYNYVIIDDDSDMLLEHKDHFVHTGSMIGLTDQDVKRAIEILNQYDK